MLWIKCVCCVNEWETNEYNDYVDTLLISILIWDRYRNGIVSMSIDGVNGSGWLVFVGKNEWMNGWMNESCVKYVSSVLIVLNECVMDVNMNVGEW